MPPGTVDASLQSSATNPVSRAFLVLPAAGSGQRMQAAVPKQYLQVHGKPLLQHTLERLAVLDCFSAVVLVLAADDQQGAALVAALPPALRAKLRLVTGGNERFRSVLNALQALQDRASASDWVLVHDAVRPCIHPDDVRRLMQSLQNAPAGGLLAVPVRETLKEGDARQQVLRTVDRQMLWQAATPQMFRYGVLRKALEQAQAQGRVVTDEAAAVEALGLPVQLVQGRADNIKVTFPEDLAIVAALLQPAQ